MFSKSAPRLGIGRTKATAIRLGVRDDRLKRAAEQCTVVWAIDDSSNVATTRRLINRAYGQSHATYCAKRFLPTTFESNQL